MYLSDSQLVTVYFRRQNKFSVKLEINRSAIGKDLHSIVKQHFFVHQKDCHFKIFYKGNQITLQDKILLDNKCIIHIAKIDKFSEQLKINVKNALSKQYFYFTINKETKLKTFIQNFLIPQLQKKKDMSTSTIQRQKKILLIAKGKVLNQQSTFQKQYLQDQAEIIYIQTSQKKAAIQNLKDNLKDKQILKSSEEQKQKQSLFLAKCPYNFSQGKQAQDNQQNQQLISSWFSSRKKYNKGKKHCPVDKQEIINLQKMNQMIQNIKWLSSQRPQISHVFDPFLKEEQFLKADRIQQANNDFQHDQNQRCSQKQIPEIVYQQNPQQTIQSNKKNRLTAGIVNFFRKIRRKITKKDHSYQQKQQQQRQIVNIQTERQLQDIQSQNRTYISISYEDFTNAKNPNQENNSNRLNIYKLLQVQKEA